MQRIDGMCVSELVSSVMSGFARRRIFATALIVSFLCASFLHAEKPPDFSGIYLRIAGPSAVPEKTLVLEVRQTANSLDLTEFQNGATASRHYNLNGHKSRKKWPDGTVTEAQARIKGRHLILGAMISSPWPCPPTSAMLVFPFETTVVASQMWELSADSQLLTIKRDLNGNSETQVYARQASLDEAKAKAKAVGQSCNQPGKLLPSPNARGEKELNETVLLGATALNQLFKSTIFSADVSSPVFKGVKRLRSGTRNEFVQAGQAITTYPDFVTLEILPFLLDESRGLGCEVHNMPAELLNLGFGIRWTGGVSRDLGPVDAELLREPWTELSPSRPFYRMQIPARDIPLNDELEIRILTKDGTQIGCISGHL